MSVQLVLGASGLVGGALLRALGARGVGTGHRNSGELRPLDVRDAAAVRDLVRALRPSRIYLPASFTNVDACEDDASTAHQVNVQGVANVVAAAGEIPLVYFSSDYVFDGNAGPYSEQAVAHPLNVYGWQKLAAEHHVALHAARALIVRTTVVYGWERQGKNFVYRLLRSLRAGERLRVPNDQIGNPTYAPDLAAASIALAEAGHSGVFNVAGRDRVSRHDFAQRAAEAFGLDASLIDPIATSALAQRARRPLNAGFDVSKTETTLGRPLVALSEGLRDMRESEHLQ